MNPTYEVLTNDDLLYEIMKWRLVEYINYPDIFIDNVVREDKNYLIKKALAQNFITLDDLDSMFYDDKFNLLSLSTLPKPRSSDIIKTNHELIKKLLWNGFVFKDNQLILKEKTNYSIFMILYLVNGNYEMVDFIRKIRQVNNEIIDQLLEGNTNRLIDLNYNGFVKYFGMSYCNKDSVHILLKHQLIPETIELIKKFNKEMMDLIPKPGSGTIDTYLTKKSEYKSYAEKIIQGLLSQQLTPANIDLINEMKKNVKIKYVPRTLYATGNLKNLKLLRETFNCKIEAGVINLGKFEKYTTDELKWFIYEYINAINKLETKRAKKSKKEPKTQLGKDYKETMNRFDKKCMVKYGRILYNRELYQDLENIMLYAFDTNNIELLNEYMKPEHNVYFFDWKMITAIYYKGKEYYEFLYNKLKQCSIDDIGLYFDMNIIINIFYTLNKLNELDESSYIYNYNMKSCQNNDRINLLNEKTVTDYIEKSSLSDARVCSLIEHINYAILTLECNYIQKYEKYDRIYNTLITYLIKIIDKYILDDGIQFNSTHILPFFNEKVYNKLLYEETKELYRGLVPLSKYDDLLLVNCIVAPKYYDMSSLKPNIKIEMTEQIYHKYKDKDLNTIINKYIIYNKTLLFFIEKYNINYQYTETVKLNDIEFFDMLKYHNRYKKSTEKIVDLIDTEYVDKIFRYLIPSDDLDTITHIIKKHNSLIKYNKNILQSIKYPEIRNLLIKYNVTYESNDIKSYEKKYELREMISVRDNQIIIPMVDLDKINVKKLFKTDIISSFYDNFVEPSDANHSIISRELLSSKSLWPKKSHIDEVAKALLPQSVFLELEKEEKEEIDMNNESDHEEEPEEIVTDDESNHSDKEEQDKNEDDDLYETVEEEVEICMSTAVLYLDGRTNPITRKKVMMPVKKWKNNN